MYLSEQHTDIWFHIEVETLMHFLGMVLQLILSSNVHFQVANKDLFGYSFDCIFMVNALLSQLFQSIRMIGYRCNDRDILFYTNIYYMCIMAIICWFIYMHLALPSTKGKQIDGINEKQTTDI